jgi:excisionase family DNA binding protein
MGDRVTEVSALVAAIMVNDPDTRAALQQLRSVHPETRATIDALILAARHRARNFAAGIRTAERGGEPDKHRDGHEESVLMTTKQAGYALGLAPRTVVDAIHAGRIYAVRHGDRWVIPATAVTDYASADVA